MGPEIYNWTKDANDNEVNDISPQKNLYDSTYRISYNSNSPTKYLRSNTDEINELN